MKELPQLYFLYFISSNFSSSNLVNKFIFCIFFILILLIISCAPCTQHKASVKLIHRRIQSKRSNLQIKLFVMSQCPYAIEAEKAIIPLI